MNPGSSIEDVPPLGATSKRLARRIAVICENRLHLFLVEAQEERERILSAILMSVLVIAFCLLAGFTVTIVVALAFWNHSPIVALLVLAALYLAVCAFFSARLMRLKRDWQTLPLSIEQLKKDRECLEKQLD